MDEVVLEQLSWRLDLASPDYHVFLLPLSSALLNSDLLEALLRLRDQVLHFDALVSVDHVRAVESGAVGRQGF